MKDDSNCKDWAAVYLPARSDGQDITKFGFKSRNEAIIYARRWYCDGCRKKMVKARYWTMKYGIANVYKMTQEICSIIEKHANKAKEDNRLAFEIDCDLDDIFGDESGSCSAEWLFMPTEKYNKCKDLGDMMEAIGAKKVWPKEEDKK